MRQTTPFPLQRVAHHIRMAGSLSMATISRIHQCWSACLLRWLLIVPSVFLVSNATAQWEQCSGWKSGEARAIVADHGFVYGLASDGSIQASQDSGRIWFTIRPPDDGGWIRSIAPTETGVVLGTDYLLNVGIWSKDDSKNEWSGLNEGLESRIVHSFLRQDQDLWAGTNDGVYRYTGAKSGWLRVGSGLPLGAVWSLAIVRSTLVAVVGSGLYSCPSRGGVWKPLGRPVSRGHVRLLGAGAELYAATSEGLFRSAVELVEWVDCTHRLEDKDITALVVAGNFIYAGTPSGLFRKPLKGEAWVELPLETRALHVHSLTVIGSKLFAGVDTELWTLPLEGGDLVEQYVEKFRAGYQKSRLTSPDWRASNSECDPGSLPANVLSKVERRVNYFRALVNLAPISFDPKLNALAQAAAFLMHKNNSLSHYPPVTWECYSEDAARGASNCNLGLSPFSFYPEGSNITGFIEDYGSNNSSCGHRRWILHSQARTMGFGATDNSQALYVTQLERGLRPDLPEYIAYPPPGLIARSIVFTRWSFSIPEQVHSDLSKAWVKMFTPSGAPVSLLQYKVAAPMGLDPGITWEVPEFDKKAPSRVSAKPVPSAVLPLAVYKVVVGGILIDGIAQQYSYIVTILDL
jgi:uncharacterized protein YkwD